MTSLDDEILQLGLTVVSVLTICLMIWAAVVAWRKFKFMGTYLLLAGVVVQVCTWLLTGLLPYILARLIGYGGYGYGYGWREYAPIGAVGASLGKLLVAIGVVLIVYRAVAMLQRLQSVEQVMVSMQEASAQMSSPPGPHQVRPGSDSA